MCPSYDKSHKQLWQASLSVCVTLGKWSGLSKLQFPLFLKNSSTVSVLFMLTVGQTLYTCDFLHASRGGCPTYSEG